MQIRIIEGIDRAAEARGTAVVIDVFRAFSTECYLVANGARRIILIETLEQAFALKQRFPDAVLMGERETRKVEGFDFGNSPAEIEEVDFQGKLVLHATTHGTRGALAASASADVVLGGSFVNATAIARYILQQGPQIVSLVALGYAGSPAEDEDSRCAQHLKALLQGEQPRFEEYHAAIRAHGNSDKFFDPARPWTPPRDFELCMTANRFDFVLRAQRGDDDLLGMEPVPV